MARSIHRPKRKCGLNGVHAGEAPDEVIDDQRVEDGDGQAEDEPLREKR